MATMLPGVRPNISLACWPTASTSPLVLLMATMEGSFTTIPFPLTYTSVLAVPRSIARSEENKLSSDRAFMLNLERYQCVIAHYVTAPQNKPSKPSQNCSSKAEDASVAKWFYKFDAFWLWMLVQTWWIHYLLGTNTRWQLDYAKGPTTKLLPSLCRHVAP